MKYKAAAEVLKKAWEPFAASAGGESRVLGDLALKMFEVQQAALAVFPPTHQEFPALSRDEVQAALDRAVAADPCQVEARAALAFLSEPKADESFQPAELQPSLLARNRDLLGISFARDAQAPILPWHAAVEYLKAKSSSFVLDDLEYLDTFLNPRFRVRGTDRHGEPFCVVLGGGLLVNDADRRSGRSRRYVFDYVSAEKQWRRFKPVMMVVAPNDVQPTEWSLEESDVCARVDALFARVMELVHDAAARQLTRIVSRFPDDVERAVRVIRAGKWQETTQEPGPGPGAPFVEQLSFIQVQFDRYGTNFPEHRQAATAAMKELTPLIERLTQLAGVQALVRGCFVSEYTQAGAPAPPRMVSNTKVSKEELPKTLRAIAAADDELRSLDAQFLEFVPPEKTPKPKESQVPRSPRDAARRSPSAAPARPESPAQPVRAIADGPSGVRLQLEMLELLGDLRFIAQLRATADPTVIGAVNGFLSAASQGLGGGDDEGLDAGTRSMIAEIDRSKRQFEEFLRQIQVGDVLPGQSQTPVCLKAHHLNRAVDAVSVMLAGTTFFGGLPAVDAEQRLERFGQECRGVKAKTDVVELLALWSTRAEVVQRWELPGCSWRLYELPDGLPLEDLAEMLDGGTSVAFTEETLDRLTQEFQKGGRPTQISLIPTATRMRDNPLVDVAGDQPSLRLDPARSLLPIFSIGLIAERVEPGLERPKPACDVDDQGKHVLAVQDRGRKLRLVLDTASVSPSMSVEYPGVDGLLPLGVSAGADERHRILRDRRSNLVSRAAVGSAGPFQIETPKGVRLTDRAVNYAWQDWRDLDRNIINTFMPNSLYLGPSLPVWLAYRRELTRAAPVNGFLWGVPRPAYQWR